MDQHIHIRASTSDLVSLATIAAHLQANGVPFPSKSDTLRYAIAHAAAAVSLTTRRFEPAAGA